MRTIAASICVLLLVLGATAQSPAKPKAAATAPKSSTAKSSASSIVTQLEKDSELSVFLRFLLRSGVRPTSGAMLVPVNSAVVRAAQSNNMTVPQMLADRNRVSDIVKLHILPDLGSNIKNSATIPTRLPGAQPVIAQAAGGKILRFKYGSTIARVLKPDIRVGNMTLYIVNSMLLPTVANTSATTKTAPTTRPASTTASKTPPPQAVKPTTSAAAKPSISTTAKPTTSTSTKTPAASESKSG